MRTIYKYKLADKILMPEHATILSLQTQKGIQCIWAEVDTENVLVERQFAIYGTGHEMSSCEMLQFIDTFQIDEGTEIYHVFERIIFV